MAKQMTRHARKMADLRNNKLPNREGRWEMKFVLDGVEYRRTHQFTASEVKHMIDLCAEFGDIAAEQIIWRAAIKGVGMVSEAVLAEAGKAIVAKYYTGPTGPASNESTATYDTLAALEGFVESRKPLPDAEAFSVEAAERIEQESMGDKL